MLKQMFAAAIAILFTAIAINGHTAKKVITEPYPKDGLACWGKPKPPEDGNKDDRKPEKPIIKPPVHVMPIQEDQIDE
jgi:hypothetical protein